jgi:hypothetical protein
MLIRLARRLSMAPERTAHLYGRGARRPSRMRRVPVQPQWQWVAPIYREACLVPVRLTSASVRFG